MSLIHIKQFILFILNLNIFIFGCSNTDIDRNTDTVLNDTIFEPSSSYNDFKNPMELDSDVVLTKATIKCIHNAVNVADTICDEHIGIDEVFCDIQSICNSELLKLRSYYKIPVETYELNCESTYLQELSRDERVVFLYEYCSIIMEYLNNVKADLAKRHILTYDNINLNNVMNELEEKIYHLKQTEEVKEYLENNKEVVEHNNGNDGIENSSLSSNTHSDGENNVVNVFEIQDLRPMIILVFFMAGAVIASTFIQLFHDYFVF